VKYRFIQEHASEFGVRLMCDILDVSRSGYYGWRRQPSSQRATADAELLAHIREIFQQSRCTYGYPRVHRELVDRGLSCGRHRVARLMRQDGLRAVHKRRYRLTTQSNHNRPVAANLLGQDFHSDSANQKWLTDITFVPTDEGWLFLAPILDLYSRMVVGWAMEDYMDRRLTLKALQMALAGRRPPAGFLHHSDRGGQYASDDYHALLEAHQALISMSRRGNVYDNAPMESFFATLKVELIHRRHYRTRDEAKADIFEYIEVFYNRRRRHSALGYLSPVEFERRHVHP
jgi:transposase InsO family protein